jgi:hypothetical protein
MTLADWVKKQGRGAISRLMRETGLAYTTILAARDQRWTARGDTARKISEATGGAVSIAELCGAAAAPSKRRARRKAA